MSRIAIVVPGGMDRSGTNRVIPALLWLIERLARRHDVHVFSLQEEGDLPAYPLCGATVHACRVVGPFARRIRTLRGIIEQQRHGPFDLIHAFWANPSGVVGALASGLLQTPLVVHLAGGELAGIGASATAVRLGYAVARR